MHFKQDNQYLPLMKKIQMSKEYLISSNKTHLQIGNILKKCLNKINKRKMDGTIIMKEKKSQKNNMMIIMTNGMKMKTGIFLMKKKRKNQMSLRTEKAF